MVGRDAVEPGRKGRVSLEFAQGLVGFHEDVLGGFLGFGVVLEHGKAISHHLFMVLADKVGIKLFFTGADFFNQFLVADGIFP